MKKTLLSVLILCVNLLVAQTPMTPSSTAVTAGSDWTTTKITSDSALNFPWEITYGPDNNLWVTERVGEKIVSVSSTTATNTPVTLIDLSSKIENSKQGGLMGMAIHPALFTDITTTVNNYVFVSYTYNDGGELKLRIARLLYNNATGNLTEDISLNPNGAILEGLPGSEDHNSGRLIFGPDNKLYYTIGDQGANQFDYACNPILSQVLPNSATDYNNYPGKTLRIEIDGSIPSDNPVLNNVQSHVYTYGHRNAQGIVFAQDGTLYNSEHGAKVDDEINVVESGKNYGWPQIAGYYDNMAYTYCNWSSLGGTCNAGDFSDHNCPSGADTATEYESYPTAGDVPSNFQPPIGTYGGTVATDPPGGWFTWPSVAPSSIDIHETANIPGWGRSLLVPTLKKGTIYRAKLNPNGNDIVGDEDPSTIDGYEEFHSSNDRYRDIAISPDGLTIFAVTDNSGGTSGPSSGTGVSIENPGVIIKIQYVGTQVTNPPVANCQDISITLDPNGNAVIVPADIDNGSTGGAAGISSLDISMDTFNCTHVGDAQIVTLTVTDNDGNQDTCTSSVTVQPNSSPAAFTAPTLESIESNCEVTVQAPTLINNACTEITATTSDPVTYTSGQSGTITWTFNDGTNTDSTTQNVTVNALPVPDNINVMPESTTAYVTWDLIEDVTFNIQYREVGSSTWLTETANTNTVTLTGLALLTNYELQINSDCGSSQSTYSSIIQFSTTDITYCTPTVSETTTNDGHKDKFYISNFELLNNNSMSILSNTSDQNTDVNGYSDHTDDGLIIPDLKQGDLFTLNLAIANSHFWNKTCGYSVWVDFDQDGVFNNTNELILGTTEDTDLISGNPSMVNENFIIPINTTLGNTRMRIAARTYYTPDNSCSMSFSDVNEGEYEDYTVNIITETLSVNSFELNGFALYPNPTNNNFTLKLPRATYKDLQVKLIDLQGRIIQEKTLFKSQSSLTFSQLNKLNSGVYFVSVLDGNKILDSKKLIKM